MYDDTGIAKAVARSPIDDACARVEAQIEVLSIEINNLYDKFSPIVAPVPKTTSPTNEERKPAGQSQMAERLFTAEVNLDRLIKRITDLTRFAEI